MHLISILPMEQPPKTHCFLKSPMTISVVTADNTTENCVNKFISHIAQLSEIVSRFNQIS